MIFNINFFVTSVLLGLGLAIDGFLLSLTNGLNYKLTTKTKTLFSATIFAMFQLAAVMIGWFCVAKLITNLMFIEDVISIIALLVLTALGTKMIVSGAKNYYKERKLNNTMQNNMNNTVQKNDKNGSILSSQTTNSTMQQDCKKSKNKLNCYNNQQQNLNNNQKLKEQNYSIINEIEQLEQNNIINSEQQKPKLKRTWLGALLFQGLVTSVDALSVGFVISKNPFISALVTALIIAFVTFTMYLLGFKIGKKFGEKIGSRAEILGGIVLVIIGIEIFITSIIK